MFLFYLILPFVRNYFIMAYFMELSECPYLFANHYLYKCCMITKIANRQIGQIEMILKTLTIFI